MIIVGIETSGTACSLSIHNENEELYYCEYDQPHAHEACLAQGLMDGLGTIGIGSGEVDAMAYSAGPGSFTGLRIGLAFAKGFTLTSRTTLIAIPTMESLAYTVLHHTGLDRSYRSIRCIIPSHRNLSYVQDFDLQGNALDTVELLEITDTIPADIYQASSLHIKLTATTIAIRGAHEYMHHHVTDPLVAVPMYNQEFIVQQKRKNTD